ncbi:LLM class flavin-dependent oxidoreductase [Actinoplanes subglobosus]|uniref:LLM class flavin-dependent oxidoreductase n=1 Tax=Actinoplanes subglobosus TaxID=1547892 RepID=A0ABV8IVW5_9ACTN
MFVALEAGTGRDIDARVTAAEAAGFVFVTLSDTPGTGIDAGVRAAFLARRTSRIGLLPQLHVTVTEPFHLATQLASLDHASQGRAGWLVGADNSPAAYATVGEPRLDDGDLHRETTDVIDVARLLWDSWQDDAILRDTTTGRFLDADRVHHVNFTGARFTVSGPLITPRPPQGQVIVAGPDTLGVTGHLDIALVAATGTDEITARAHRARADGAALVFADLPEVDTGLLDRLAGVVDGVRLLAAVPDVDLPAVAAAIGPRPPARDTLRATLGLTRPASQFA